MKKNLSMFRFSGRPAPGSGYPLILAGGICILLLSLPLLSTLIPRCGLLSPGLRLLVNQLPLVLICPLFMILTLRKLNRGLSLKNLLDLRDCSPEPLRRICRKNLRILLLLFPIIQLLILLTVHILHLFGFQHLPQQHFFLPEYIHSWSYCLSLFLCTVFLAPISEELLFRHFICNAAAEHLPLPLPQLLTSTLFAVFHGIPQAIPSLFLLAMVLQKRKDEDGLIASILLHSSYNLLIFLILFIKEFYFSPTP